VTVSTAIIPVAGLGTRVLPASKAIPKEMLPVVDKPAIQYVIEEAVSAGIKKIILVTRSGKQAIEDHFDRNFELETILNQKGKTEILRSIKSILPDDVQLISVRQDSPAGLGHAVLSAAPVIADEPFAVLLPDVLVEDACAVTDLQHMILAFNERGHSQIMVEQVPDERVSSYGIVDCDGYSLEPGQSIELKGMVEKPAPATAPSNLAIVGRYILPSRIMTLLQETPPGAGGEIQLTDAIESLVKEAPVQAYKMTGNSHDCGNKAGYLLANIAYGLRHPETAAALGEYISAQKTSK